MRTLHLLLLLGGAACSSNSAGAPGQGDAGLSPDGNVSCQNDSRVDTYVANLTKASPSGNVKVAIVSADPAPPGVGTNGWTLRVTDGGGQPISNAQLTVAGFMPDHGHPASVKPTITPKADGTYTVENLSLFMAGVWRVTVTVSPASAGDAGAGESAVFFFCVAG